MFTRREHAELRATGSAHGKRAAEMFATVIFSRVDLVAQGMSWWQIASAVERGRLVRLRRDRYAFADVDADVIEAVRIGGRLSCDIMGSDSSVRDALAEIIRVLGPRFH